MTFWISNQAVLGLSLRANGLKEKSALTPDSHPPFRTPHCTRAKISSLGTYVPPKILTNADLEKMVETNDQWIVERTGIKQRHVVDKGTATSDLAVEAAKDCLARGSAVPRHPCLS